MVAAINFIYYKINGILGKEAIKSDTSSQSYREILYPYMSDFYMKLGIQLIFGTKVDEPAARLFLPYEFKEAISTAKINGNKKLFSLYGFLLSVLFSLLVSDILASFTPFCRNPN